MAVFQIENILSSESGDKHRSGTAASGRDN